MMDEHHVCLDAFEGPLDLLLFLIRKNEVDIHDIPVAAITDQYLKELETLTAPGSMARIDIDLAGEFLVMAATLMEIKSRLLSPKPASTRAIDGSDARDEDPRAELVRQLLVYKQFRDAADALERRALDWSRRYPAGPALAEHQSLHEAMEVLAEGDEELDEIQIIDLVEAFRRIAETVNFERLGEHQVTYDDVPVELHAEDIVDRLRRHARGERLDDTGEGEEMEFKVIFTGRTRSEMVGLFLALLQLVRQQRVAFRPDPERNRLLLRLGEGKSDLAPSDDPPPETA
jgi:segregation and condensation protein A